MPVVTVSYQPTTVIWLSFNVGVDPLSNGLNFTENKCNQVIEVNTIIEVSLIVVDVLNHDLVSVHVNGDVLDRGGLEG